MPQTVAGYGSIPIKPGSRAAVAEAAEQFDGWLEWDQFELTDDRLTYAYDDIVTISTAGDLDDFFEEIACKHAAAARAHYDEDGDAYFYGPDERHRLEAEIAEREAQVSAAERALATARAKYADLNQS